MEYGDGVNNFSNSVESVDGEGAHHAPTCE
jgi:hypothetical protein